MSSVVDWLLDETARQELLSLFSPVYPDVIGWISLPSILVSAAITRPTP